MPELPEVEIVKRGLLDSIKKLKVKKIFLFTTKLRFNIPNDLGKKIENYNIKDVLRRGKNGIILTDGKYHLHFHLGMTGYFKISKKTYKKEKHDHLAMQFYDGTYLVYNDVRKFGYISLIEKPFDIVRFQKLGFEPNLILLKKNEIIRIFKSKTKSIKNLLLDQLIISGIGNIYACEILYDAKVLPTKVGKDITKKEIENILLSTVKVLKKAIIKGGTSIRDYKNVEGNLGYFQTQFKVYDRKGLSCYKCKSLIIKIKQSGRSTYYCPTCQK